MVITLIQSIKGSQIVLQKYHAKRTSVHPYMVFFPNPPEADKSLRLPCEMRSPFLWGYAQKIILGILHICLPVPVLQRGGYFFSHAFLSRSFYRGILSKNPHLWIDTNEIFSFLFWEVLIKIEK